jgi:branched-chain amino acid aminotransferase
MAAFGTVFMPHMAFTTFENNQWNEATIVASDSIQLHPGAHVLHYSSTCFEGLKAFKHADGSIHVFRMDQNLGRFDQSSRLL